MKFFWRIFTAVCILFASASAYAAGTGSLYDDESLLKGQLQTADMMLYAIEEGDLTYTDEQGVIYKIVGTYAYVAGYTPDIQPDIIIPTSIKSGGKQYYVRLIEGGAFRYCTSLKSIVTGSMVTTISGLAFDSCTSLERVELSNSGIASIYPSTFRNCTALKEISITNVQPGVQTRYGFWVDNGVLYGPARDLTIENEEDDFPLKTAVIAYPAAKTDTVYTVSDKAEMIAAWAFSSCVNLESITVPASVSVVDGYAFQYCENLSELSLPESVLKIGKYTFDGCSSLETVTIPQSVTSIGENVFSGCPENIIILGEPDSPAEDYAKNNNILFNQARITFVTNGGESIDDCTVDCGQALTEPAAPERTYFEFAGWYSDADCTEKWDFNTAVQKNMSLYAKWNKIPYKINISDSGITAELIDDSPKKIFAASYNEDGRMIDAVTLDAAEAVDLGGLVTEGAESVRVFLWSGAEKVFPLCTGAKR